MSFDKQHVMGAAAEASEPALVSDQAPAGLDPTGVDQAQVHRDEAFANAVWEALKGDHNDLRKQAIILQAHRAALEASSRQEERLRLACDRALQYLEPDPSEAANGIKRRIRAALEPPHAKEQG